MKKYLITSLVPLLITSCTSMNNGTIQNNRYVSSKTHLSVEVPITGDMFFQKGLIDPNNPDYPQVPAMRISDGINLRSNGTEAYFADFLAGDGYYLIEGASYSVEWFHSPKLTTRALLHDMQRKFKFHAEKYVCKPVTLRNQTVQQCINLKFREEIAHVLTVFNANGWNVIAQAYYPPSVMPLPQKAYYHFINSIKVPS